jgi:hypothetical protein
MEVTGIYQEPYEYEYEYEYEDNINFGVSVRWNVNIPEVRTFMIKKSGETYNAFKIVVNDDKMEWYLWKRYREFHELHQNLSKKIFFFTCISPAKNKAFY